MVLFVADLDTLKQELRLSGVPAGMDAETMVQGANLQVRTEIYSRLGGSRVTEILATAYTATPTTDAQIIRALANRVEIIWTRLVLMDLLPILFMDASGGDQEFLNQEGTFRSLAIENIRRQKAEHLAKIEEWLSILAGDVAIGDAPSANIHTQSDQSPRAFPIGTLIGHNERLFGDPTRAIDGEVLPEDGS